MEISMFQNRDKNVYFYDKKILWEPCGTGEALFLLTQVFWVLSHKEKYRTDNIGLIHSSKYFNYIQ